MPLHPNRHLLGDKAIHGVLQSAIRGAAEAATRIAAARIAAARIADGRPGPGRS